LLIELFNDDVLVKQCVTRDAYLKILRMK